MASEGGFYARLFQRHAHPFSAWSRLLSTPLLLVPLWTRRWWLYGPIGAWLAVNPVITPPIHDTSSFATRAILGEESWSRRPTSEPVLLALTGVASASLAGAMVAAYQRRKTGAVIGTGVFMALTLWSGSCGQTDSRARQVGPPPDLDPPLRAAWPVHAAGST